MQFHGTWSVPISMTIAVPWNSMELECANIEDTIRSMEFHGISSNLEWANFDDMSCSVEFYGTWNALISIIWAVPLNLLELHGT